MGKPLARLTVHDWSEHQTYRNDRGQPPWIKVHRHLMRNLKWVELSDAERGQLIAIWLLAADHEGTVPASPALLQKLCFMSSRPNISKFIELGLLECDDATLASEWRQDDVPEVEAEAEEEAEKKQRRKTLVRSAHEIFGPTPGFDEFWAEYPKKVNKKKARDIWQRKKLDRIAEQIIDHVRKRAATDKTWINGYVLHPERFLRDERWNDSLDSGMSHFERTQRELERMMDEREPIEGEVISG